MNMKMEVDEEEGMEDMDEEIYIDGDMDGGE